MQAKQYTYTEDIQQDAIETYYRKRNRQKKVNRKYFIKQKLFGVVMVGFGVLIPFIADGDATISLLIVPMALYMIFTKEKVLMIR